MYDWLDRLRPRILLRSLSTVVQNWSVLLEKREKRPRWPQAAVAAQRKHPMIGSKLGPYEIGAKLGEYWDQSEERP